MHLNQVNKYWALVGIWRPSSIRTPSCPQVVPSLADKDHPRPWRNSWWDLWLMLSAGVNYWHFCWVLCMCLPQPLPKHMHVFTCLCLGFWGGQPGCFGNHLKWFCWPGLCCSRNREAVPGGLLLPFDDICYSVIWSFLLFDRKAFWRHILAKQRGTK